MIVEKDYTIYTIYIFYSSSLSSRVENLSDFRFDFRLNSQATFPILYILSLSLLPVFPFSFSIFSLIPFFNLFSTGFSLLFLHFLSYFLFFWLIPFLFSSFFSQSFSQSYESNLSTSLTYFSLQD